jgi:hypothetical protein
MMIHIDYQAPLTLWDRVQNVLHNNPAVVVILLLVICLAGIKTILEAYRAVQSFLEDHEMKNRTETSVLPCSRAASIKSRAAVAQEETSLTFINGSSKLLAINWIDENGASIPYGVLEPGTQREQLSYPAHVWILSEPGRACIGIVVKGTAPSVVELKPDGSLKTRLVNH